MSYPTTPPGVSRNCNAVDAYPFQASNGEESSSNPSSSDSTPSSARNLPEGHPEGPENLELPQNQFNDLSPEYPAWLTAQNSAYHPESRLHFLQGYCGSTSPQEHISTNYGTTNNQHMALFEGALGDEQNGYTTFNQQYWQEFNPEFNLIGDNGFIGEDEQVARQLDPVSTDEVFNYNDVAFNFSNESREVNGSGEQRIFELGFNLDNSDIDRILDGDSGSSNIDHSFNGDSDFAEFMYTGPTNYPGVINYSDDEANTAFSHSNNDGIDPALNTRTAVNTHSENTYISPYTNSIASAMSAPVQQTNSPKKRKQSCGSISSDSSIQSPTKKQKQKQKPKPKHKVPKSPIIGNQPPLVLTPHTPLYSQKVDIVETEKVKMDTSPPPNPNSPTKKILTLAEAINMPYSVTKDGKKVKMYCPIRDPRWLKEAVCRWATENMRDQILVGVPVNGTLRDVETFDFVNCFNIYASVFDNKPEKRNKMILGFMQGQYSKPKEFKIINPYLPHTLSTAPDQLVGPVGPIRNGFGELFAFKQHVKQVEDANTATFNKAREIIAGHAALVKENAELKTKLKAFKNLASKIPEFN